MGKSRNTNPSNVKRAAERLELDITHLTNFPHPVAAPTHPFSTRPKPGGRSGVRVAAKWFLDRGYAVPNPDFGYERLSGSRLG